MPRELNVPRVQETIRKDLIRRFARIWRGRPVFCGPSTAERYGVVQRKEGAGSDGKVIFDSKEKAEECARFLVSLGSRPMYAYPCGRSRRSHFHLATDRSVA